MRSLIISECQSTKQITKELAKALASNRSGLHYLNFESEGLNLSHTNNFASQLLNSNLQTKKMDLLCNFLVYIKECMEQAGSGVKEAEIIHLFKDSVVLVTNHGRKLPSRDIIHFSSSYRPDPDLEKLFPGINSCEDKQKVLVHLAKYPILKKEGEGIVHTHVVIGPFERVQLWHSSLWFE